MPPASDWIVIADSNVLMPRDYVQRLLAGWRRDTGILCSPPIGCTADGFWAELECAFLNTYQARWQYAADSLGAGFAQGKTMLVRRRDLVQAGGIQALGRGDRRGRGRHQARAQPAGSARALVDAPFGQPLGGRTAQQVWDRQTRWARLRRITFPGFFAAEILTGSLLPLAGARLRGRRRRPAGRWLSVAALRASQSGSAREALLARARRLACSRGGRRSRWALRDVAAAARSGLHAWLSNSFDIGAATRSTPPPAAPKLH